MGPDVAQRFEWAVDRCAPLILDAKCLVTGNLADLLRGHAILSRTLQNAGKQRRLDRDDSASAALVEECVFRGRFGSFQHDTCAKPASREATFRQRDCYAAVTDVVRGLYQTVG